MYTGVVCSMYVQCHAICTVCTCTVQCVLVQNIMIVMYACMQCMRHAKLTGKHSLHVCFQLE